MRKENDMFMTRYAQPASVAWPAFDQMLSLRNELDRLFENPFAELARASSMLSGWAPAIDFYEDKDNFVVKAEVPGMKKEDIEISLQEGILTLSGERTREAKCDGDCRSERFFGKFVRSVALPKTVVAEKTTASYKDGILTVTLPKAEEVKPRQIQVNIN